VGIEYVDDADDASRQGRIGLDQWISSAMSGSSCAHMRMMVRRTAWRGQGLGAPELLEQGRFNEGEHHLLSWLRL
jgi:hypothetical protein